MNTKPSTAAHTLIEKSLLLKNTWLMESLELSQLLSIADKLTFSKAGAGEVVFDSGEQAYSIFFISNGSVHLSAQNQNESHIIGRGDFFGEESLLSGLPRAYKAVAGEPTEMFTLSKTNLLAVLHEHPALAVDLLESFASSMQFRQRNFKAGSFSHGGTT
ncbi:cyclic nucleotide-binding domain-containing protein [Estrella lausannensis]|uniref:Cyclic nucleotide-binding protein n=1 Tax=Estrella lausannensis TaxID=483423 RepID=A0A0H5DQ15_9BACT|nr:cyclic nucleotide-binding domain-containing protein [Estrella lausannensis]CRX38133.1 Cyclic nucleotide-binding protein [Estrella lausannensis]